jgi:hypothetical protein
LSDCARACGKLEQEQGLALSLWLPGVSTARRVPLDWRCPNYACRCTLAGQGASPSTTREEEGLCVPASNCPFRLLQGRLHRIAQLLVHLGAEIPQDGKERAELLRPGIVDRAAD